MVIEYLIDLLVIFTGFNFDVVSIDMVHVFWRSQFINGFLVPSISDLESYIVFIIVIDAFRAFQLKCWNSFLESRRFITMEYTRGSFWSRIGTGTENYVVLGGTRRRWIVPDSRDTCEQLDNSLQSLTHKLSAPVHDRTFHVLSLAKSSDYPERK